MLHSILQLSRSQNFSLRAQWQLYFSCSPEIFNRCLQDMYGGVLISSQPDKEGNKLQPPNTRFIQHNPHEAQYTSQPVALTFASHLRKLSVQPGLRGSNELGVRRKMANFQLFFSVQRTGGSPTGPDPENRVGDQDIGPVSSGLQAPGEPGHWRARTRPPW